eukprot:scaffold32915_cov61-Phaeocystis_antarctica.AAC.4
MRCRLRPMQGCRSRDGAVRTRQGRGGPRSDRSDVWSCGVARAPEAAGAERGPFRSGVRRLRDRGRGGRGGLFGRGRGLRAERQQLRLQGGRVQQRVHVLPAGAGRRLLGPRRDAVCHTGLEPRNSRQGPSRSATHTFEPRLGQPPRGSDARGAAAALGQLRAAPLLPLRPRRVLRSPPRRGRPDPRAATLTLTLTLTLTTDPNPNQGRPDPRAAHARRAARLDTLCLPGGGGKLC